MSTEHKLFDKHGDKLFIDEQSDRFDIHIEDGVGAAYIAQLTAAEIARIGIRLLKVASYYEDDFTLQKIADEECKEAGYTIGIKV